MPVYGKGRTHRPAKKKALRRNWGFEVKRKPLDWEKDYLVKKKYLDVRSIGFGVQHTSLAGVKHGLNFNLSLWVRDRYASTQRPVRVLDLGCGTGRAISQLSKEFGEKIDALGFDQKLYLTWQKNREVRFIHEEADAYRRYFKPESLDLVYSHHGWWHEVNEKKYGLFRERGENDIEHLHQIGVVIKSLRPGGVFVCNFQGFPRKDLREILEYARDHFPDCHAQFRQVYRFHHGKLPILIVRKRPIQKRQPTPKQGELFPAPRHVHIQLAPKRK